MPSKRLLIQLAVLGVFGICCEAAAPSMESLVSSADLYYQVPFGKPHEIRLDMVESLNNKSNLKVIIHGFLGSRTHSSIIPLHNAYMAKGGSNVILADWEEAANLDYPRSRAGVQMVAVHFGKLLKDFMMRLDIAPTEMHIIGHSLGAHIAGAIGDYFNGSLGRVTGLDPALPLFKPRSKDSLQKRAANFVDVIHTDFPVFGDFTPRGHVDFYPNFGHAPQPGCESLDLITASKFLFEKYSCSHNLAVILYAESIGLKKNFPAIPCSLSAIGSRNPKSCLRKLSKFGLSRIAISKAIYEENASLVVYMGEGVKKGTTGFYYLQTHEQPPYGLGAHTEF